MEQVKKALLSMSEVTINEAITAVMSLGDRVDAMEPEAIQILSEIAGNAAVNNNPEMLRRFIVYVVKNGPIVK